VGAGLIRVTPEQLATADGKLRDLADEIRSTLYRIAAEVKALEASWHGTAEGAFTSFYLRWDRGGKDLTDSLEALAANLGVAAVNYDDTETANTRTFAGLSARPGWTGRCWPAAVRGLLPRNR
jgi:WXG100 family type VII secretion target